LLRNKANESLNWYKSLEEYYFRPEWELYDLKVDGQEKFNVATKESYQVNAS
jgi:N-sulfoglucosamine sulfohydrolase